MRKFCLALPLFLMATAVLHMPLHAQQQQAQQQPPAAPSAQDLLKLDDTLLKWEKAMTDIKSLLVFVQRTSVDRVFRTTEVYEGTAKFVKGAAGQTPRASLDLQNKNKPSSYEKLICTGTYVYEFAPREKVIRIHQLPPPKPGQIADDNFLSFLFGMKAVDAKKRYKLTYVPPRPEDKYYLYVKIQPIALSDAREFSEARLTLWANNHLPRQVWFKQPNGNEVTWDFPRVVNGADIRLTDFAQPPLPAADWRYQPVAADNPPRVARPNR